MLLQKLQYASLILQRHLPLRYATLVFFDCPGRLVIRPFVGVISRKKAIIEAEFGIYDERSVCIVFYIKFVIEIVVENILDHPSEEGNIRARTEAGIDISLCRSPRKSWIYVNECAALVPGCLNPLEGYRMVFCYIAAHIKDYISIAEINIMVCHGAASERLCQSRYSGAVSYSGLVLDIDEAESPEHLLIKPALLIVERCTAYGGDSVSPVHSLAVRILFNEALVAALLDIGRYLVQCPFPGYLFPSVAVRGTIAYFGEPVIVDSDLVCGSPFGTKCALADRMVRVTLGVNHLAFTVCGHQDAAPYRTITTYSGCFLGALDPEFGPQLSCISLYG